VHNGERLFGLSGAKTQGGYSYRSSECSSFSLGWVLEGTACVPPAASKPDASGGSDALAPAADAGAGVEAGPGADALAPAADAGAAADLGPAAHASSAAEPPDALGSAGDIAAPGDAGLGDAGAEADGGPAACITGIRRCEPTYVGAELWMVCEGPIGATSCRARMKVKR
jgi:hypothetical protein